MFEQAFKNIDNVLWKEAGCTTELDYTEQTSWLLFLKYLDALEQDKADEAKLEGKKYSFILDKPYRWESWAAPKDKDGKIDHNRAQTGDDLRDFVNQKLFPYLHGFKQKASGPNTVEYKIGEIFGEIKNKISSGYNLREIIDHIDELRFRSQTEKHELSHLYEAKIRNMGNAGRNGGEYYTPRPLIRAIVQVVKPKIGERIYDGAVGSAGFLCESFEYLKTKKGLTTKDLTTLQTRTFYGKEKKSLAYVIGIMNMILHGIEAPNIIHTNTLTENLADIQEKDRFDVVLANPPFGGKERKEVQQNFPIRTAETAYLFLQHFIKILKAGGRGGVVIKNTFLSNTDNASVSLRKKLLEECNLHTVLDCPKGTFLGAGVQTVVLFFEKGPPTRNIWFYQLDPGRNMGKTNSLNDTDLSEFINLQKSFTDSAKSWRVDAGSIDRTIFDLSVRNPNAAPPLAHRRPNEIMAEIATCDFEHEETSFADDLKTIFIAQGGKWQRKKLAEVCTTFADGDWIESKDQSEDGIRLIQTGNVGTGVFKNRVEKARFISEATFRRLNCTEIVPGDCLISRLPDPIGRACIIPDTGQRMITAVDCTIVRFDTKQLLPEFFNYYAQSPQYLADVNEEITGTTRNRISRGNLGEIKIPVPSPPEQKRIVAELDSLLARAQRLESIYQRKLAALDALKQSLLHQAFTGNL